MLRPRSQRVKTPASAPPAIGTIVDVDIVDLLANGQGVGRVDGVVVFVWGPLPGERARICIVEVKAKFMVADCIDILERSADRVEPFCGVFGACGGCQVQHLSYPAQLRWKRTVVAAALQRIGALGEVAVEETVGMETPRAYRNKMALVVDQSDERPRLGFYQMRSHELVPIDDCPIVLPALDRDLHELTAAAADPARNALFEDVRHIVVRRSRAGTDGVAALTTLRPQSGVAPAAEALRTRMPGIRSMSNSFDPAGENVILGRREQLIAGGGEMEEQLGALRFRVSVHSFFQVNTEMVERIFAELAPLVTPGMKMLDLYCGAGTFSIFFASHGASVVGFEENTRAIEEARVNAALNGVVEQTDFAAGRVEALVKQHRWRKTLDTAEVIFLDPPRKGSDEATLSEILGSSARVIWYLSCNPATLARDCARLAGGGFALERVVPFDMFPQTGHVETLALLRRA